MQILQLVVALGLVVATNAGAASWDEALQGDLSNDRSQPTPLLLDLGANPVRGAFGAPDLDYLAVTVRPGQALSALRIGADNRLGGVRSFMAVQTGSAMTVPPDTDSASGLLGAMHYQQGFPGGDLLPDLGDGQLGAIGFSGALPAGTYTFWIQDTSAEPGLRFAMVFEVSAVPEPETLAMLLAGLAVVGAAVRRRTLNPTA